MQKTLKKLCGDKWPEKKNIHESSAVYMPFEDMGYNKCLDELSQITVEVPDHCRHEAWDREKLAKFMVRKLKISNQRKR